MVPCWPGALLRGRTCCAHLRRAGSLFKPRQRQACLPAALVIGPRWGREVGGDLNRIAFAVLELMSWVAYARRR